MTGYNFIGIDLLEVGILIALPSFIGALSSDYVKTLQGTYLKVKVGRVLASGAFATFVGVSAFYNYFKSIDNMNLLMLICFLVGMIAFELVQYLATLDGWLKLVGKLKNILIPVFQMLSAFNEFRKSYKGLGGNPDGAVSKLEQTQIPQPQEPKPPDPPPQKEGEQHDI